MNPEPEAVEELDELTQETDEPEQSDELPDPDSAPDPEDESPTPDEAEPSESERFQKRMDKVTARAYAAERKADYLQGLLDGQKAAAPVKPEPELKEPDPPNPDDFDNDFSKFAQAQNQYVADLRKYDREVAKRDQAKARQQTERATLSEKQKRQRDWIQKGAEVHEDFLDVTEFTARVATKPCSQAMLDAAERLENGHDVLYRIMSDPSKAQEFSQLSATDVALEMAKMQTAKPGNKGTGAPQPPNPARGGGDKARVDEDKLSTAEAIKRDRERRRKIGLR